MTSRTPAAFTLVELLVVIAMIGMLISLMLPAIQATRETARRTTCQSHLAQLGVAFQNYEAAHGTLPPGTTEPKGPVRNVPEGNHISWAVHLLPHLEENVAFKQVDFAAGAYDAKNAPVRRIRISTFTCPSDSGGPDQFAAGSYAGCHHDVEAPINQDNHGVLFLNSHVAARDVTDGLEQTIFLGEKRGRADDLGWMSGTRATLRNTGTPINEGLESAETAGDKAAELAVGGFGSHHPGGAQFLFGDGAVRMLRDDINMGVFQQLGHRADGKLLTTGPTRE